MELMRTTAIKNGLEPGLDRGFWRRPHERHHLSRWSYRRNSRDPVLLRPSLSGGNHVRHTGSSAAPFPYTGVSYISGDQSLPGTHGRCAGIRAACFRGRDRPRREFDRANVARCIHRSLAVIGSFISFLWRSSPMGSGAMSQASFANATVQQRRSNPRRHEYREPS